MNVVTMLTCRICLTVRIVADPGHLTAHSDNVILLLEAWFCKLEKSNTK